MSADAGEAAREASSEAAVPIGPGREFEGLLVLHGPARIEGRLRGAVVSSSWIEIGPDADVDADIEAAEVIVAGRLDGEVRASRRIQLLPSARVQAALHAPDLALAPGAQVRGPGTSAGPRSP